MQNEAGLRVAPLGSNYAVARNACSAHTTASA